MTQTNNSKVYKFHDDEARTDMHLVWRLGKYQRPYVFAVDARGDPSERRSGIIAADEWMRLIGEVADLDAAVAYVRDTQVDVTEVVE